MTALDHLVQAKKAVGRGGVEHLLPYLHVVLPISNPVRYTSRYVLFLDFVERIRAAGIEPWIVETQQGLRSFAVTESGNPRHVQLRTEEELWIKENMLNIGIRRLPDDWKYVAWIDADIEFQRTDWVEETIHRLQDAHVVQMFQSAIDLGPTGETLSVHKGFVWSYQNNMPLSKAYSSWHSGYAWACTREAYDMMGGLFEYGILGSGDRHMALGLIGYPDLSLNPELHQHYKDVVHRWSARALASIKKDIGYVPGTIIHHWHGKKRNRGYQDRWKVLINTGFDPLSDLWRDAYGLFRLEHDRIELRDAIRKYFRSRNEDSIDLE